MASIRELGARLQRWLDENPEAWAKIQLWFEESSHPPQAERGLAGSFLDQLLPVNWQTLRIGQLQAAQRLMEETGICLVWVPRAEVIQALLSCANKPEREQALLKHAEEILADIDAILAAASHPQIRELKESGAEAVAAFRSGYERASQALSAAVVSAILEDHYGFEGFGHAREAFEAERPTDVGVWSSRRVSIQVALHRAILRSDQMPPDGGFNRHLTAHSVDGEQYSRPNTLSALLLAAGSLRELQEMYRIGERGFAPTPQLRQGAAPRLLTPPPQAGNP
jgi:hypothetical protein